MRKLLVRGLPAVVAMVLIAGCATGPKRLSQRWLNQLKSAQVIYVSPERDFYVYIHKPPGNPFLVGYMFGFVGAAAWFGLDATVAAQTRADTDAQMAPYKSQLDSIHFGDQLYAGISNCISKVSLFTGTKIVHEPHDGDVHKLIVSGKSKSAVVIVPIVGFDEKAKNVVTAVRVTVDLNDDQLGRWHSIADTVFTARARVESTKPRAKPAANWVRNPYIAALKINLQQWFANDGEQINAAFNSDITQIQAALEAYFGGGQTPAAKTSSAAM